MENSLINKEEMTKVFNKEEINRVFDFLDVSETTRLDYKARIMVFIKFLERNEFNYNSFLQFKRELADKIDIGISTKNKYLATAKIFLKELNKKGLLPTDITQNVKSFRQSKKHKKCGINKEEVALLFDKLNNLDNTMNNDRIKAMIALLVFQGLRQCEITRLDILDLDLLNNKALILGKGQDDKELIDLHPKTSIILKDYLDSNKMASGALFVSISNNNRNRRITTRAFRGIIKTILNDLHIEKTTHGFRHFFTTKLIEIYKGDLLEVAKYTRHKTLEMLTVYNDNITKEKSLPKYYEAFNSL